MPELRIDTKRFGKTLGSFLLLMFLLVAGCMPGGTAGNGSGGNGDDGSGNAGGTVDQVTGPRLIGASGSGICTFRLDENLEGEVDPLMVLPQSESCLDGISELAINSAGQLLVLTRGNGDCNIGPEDGYRVNVYADATRLNGSQQPIRVAQTADVEFNLTGGAEMVLDEARDILYVVRGYFDDRTARSEILAYANTTQAEFDGTVAPTHRFTIEAIGTSTPQRPILVDDTMYLPSNALYRIPNVSEADGTLSEDKYDTVAFGGSPFTPVSHVDDSGRFYWISINTSTSLDTSMSGRIQQYSADTTTRERTAIISSIGFPNLLGIGADGMIYVGAINATGEELRVYNPIESVVEDELFEPIRVAFNTCFNENPVLIVD